VKITVEKQDVETGNVLADTVFGIYNATDIVNKDGKVIVAADTPFTGNDYRSGRDCNMYL